MGSFRLKVDSPGLVIVDSTDDKLYNTAFKKCFLLGFFLQPLLRSSVLHDLRKPNNCYVDLEYILYKVITAKCCGSVYADTFNLMLIP